MFLGVVNLGTIKNAPKITPFINIKHYWKDEEKVGEFVKLDIPFTFDRNKTYIVLIRSNPGTVEIGGESVAVPAIKVITNRIQNLALSGNTPFSAVGTDFTLTFPDYSLDSPGIYILRPEGTEKAAIFSVAIYEL